MGPFPLIVNVMELSLYDHVRFSPHEPDVRILAVDKSPLTTAANGKTAITNKVKKFIFHK